MNLKSNLNQLGKTVTQILYNVNGEKKTIHGVRTETIEQSQFTRFDTVDGHRFMVNDKLVWLIEVIPEETEWTGLEFVGKPIILEDEEKEETIEIAGVESVGTITNTCISAKGHNWKASSETTKGVIYRCQHCEAITYDSQTK